MIARSARRRDRALDNMAERLRCRPDIVTPPWVTHPPGWWNWQTRRTQNPLLLERAGSSPAPGTQRLPAYGGPLGVGFVVASARAALPGFR